MHLTRASGSSDATGAGNYCRSNSLFQILQIGLGGCFDVT